MTDMPAAEKPEIVEPAAEKSETVEQAAEKPEIVESTEVVEADQEEPSSVSEPAKVMRIGTMIRQLLEEVRSTELDEPGRDRLKEIYETSVEELAAALSPDLRAELERLVLPFDDDEVPSGPELRVAQAQLVGWLEGLFHGIQATLFAQQAAARQQLEQMQGQRLPPGGPGPAGRDGVYL